MVIRNLYKFSLALLISFSAYADIAGEYEKVSGNEDCPTGNILIKKGSQNKRVLIFGSTHSWNLDSSNNSKTTESADGGCTYELTYNLDRNQFNAKTKRLKCPEKSEDAVIIEKINLKEKALTYQYGEESSKIEMQMCKYTKIK